MRGSGGMILSYGVLEGEHGTLDLVEFGRIDDVEPTSAVSSVLVPDDYVERWEGFEALERWRQANLAADFTLVAPVLQAMYESARGLSVDGVIQIDPSGLAALLDGVGPVQVPELGEVRGDNVEALVLNEAYVRFPGVEERSDVLGDVAEAAFDRLVEGDVPSLRTLARRLVEAVDARHVVVHADDEATQRLIEGFGADGRLPGRDDLPSWALTVQNLSGNKLDWYLDTSLHLEGTLPEGEPGKVRATIALANTAPPASSLPRYIVGPGSAVGAPPAGVERALVTLYPPFGSRLVQSSAADVLEGPTSGTEGSRPYVAFIVDVPAGETRSVDLELTVAPRPDGAVDLLLLPSPRVRPTLVTVRLDLGREPRLDAEVPLDRTWRLTSGAPATPVVGTTLRRE
jgi:hypothetical protein